MGTLDILKMIDSMRLLSHHQSRETQGFVSQTESHGQVLSQQVKSEQSWGFAGIPIIGGSQHEINQQFCAFAHLTVG